MNRGRENTQEVSELTGRDASYRVEVSGWDARENFFVEKTSLDWRDREGKTVALHAAIRLDSVLFVRLLRPLGGGADFPVPHRAVSVEDRSTDAFHMHVGLEQMQPWRVTRGRMPEGIDPLVENSVNH